MSETPALEPNHGPGGSAAPGGAVQSPPSAAPESAPSQQPSPSPPALLQSASARWLTPLAFLVALVSLAGLVTASGIWDPHELGVADLSRRIALNLLGAEGLALEGADNRVPILSELGRGELPFTSVALGFRLFGLREWAGRLPLALWGLVGVIALYQLLRRLVDGRTGAFAVLVLATMPLYFVQARTMLGDIVTMAGSALAVAGLGVALFQTGAGAGARSVGLLLGAVGLLAGFGSRGLLIGTLVPSLGLTLGWLVWRTVLPSASDRFSTWTGCAVLAVSALALGLGVHGLSFALAQPGEYSMLLGTAIDKQRKLPTFDSIVLQLGHGLFPWSALLPVALGRLFTGQLREQAPAELGLRIALVLVATVGFGVHGLLAPLLGNVPFGPVAVLAGAVALAFRDLERDAPPSRSAAMAVVCFAVLLYLDFKNFPDKGLTAFVVPDAKFPESFQDPSLRYVQVSLVLFAAACFAGLFERSPSEPEAAAPRPDPYRRWVTLLRSAHGGNLAFLLGVVGACWAAVAVLRALSDWFFQWRYFEQMPSLWRGAVDWGWLLPLLVVVAPLAVYAARDAVRLLCADGLGLQSCAAVVPRLREPVARLYAAMPRLRRTRISRSALGVIGGAAAGAVLSFGYYPALAAQVSPREVFEAYSAMARPGEPLGLLGMGSGVASYYAGRDVPTFQNTTQAFKWLVAGEERRWLLIREADLPQMNSAFRSRSEPRRNLPVLNADTSEILLVSNQLGAGEPNRNPLEGIVRTQPPAPSRRLDANLGRQLEVLGWDVLDSAGRSVDAVVPGRPYQFLIHYRVQSSISGNWETFIHIDGYQRRYNGDHATIQGKYPFHLWRPGDFITDSHTFTLEPNFSPGLYSVFFGLFIGDRRLEVVRGDHHENRVRAGALRVR